MKSVCVCLAGLFIGLWTAKPAAGAKPLPPLEHWYQLETILDRVMELKKEVVIDAGTAAKILGPDRALLDDWQAHLPAKMANAPDAETVPEAVKRDWRPARGDEKPFFRVLKFSAKDVVVMVLQDQGSYRGRPFEKCLACVRVARSKDVNDLVGLASLAALYERTYKGLKHGDLEGDVQKLLGKSDGTLIYMYFGFYQAFYFKDDIVVTFDCGRILHIETPVPQGIKDEIKAKGPGLVRG